VTNFHVDTEYLHNIYHHNGLIFKSVKVPWKGNSSVLCVFKYSRNAYHCDLADDNIHHFGIRKYTDTSTFPFQALCRGNSIWCASHAKEHKQIATRGYSEQLLIYAKNRTCGFIKEQEFPCRLSNCSLVNKDLQHGVRMKVRKLKEKEVWTKPVVAACWAIMSLRKTLEISDVISPSQPSWLTPSRYFISSSTWPGTCGF
jgi:hypothetical protein